MSEELIVSASSQQVVPTELIRLDDDFAGVAQAPPSPQQIQASQEFFQQEHEAHLVAGLLGVWTSVGLLHDLAASHLGGGPKEEAKKEKPQLPQKDE